MNGSCLVFGDCLFDNGMCIWINSWIGDVFDWIIGGGGIFSFLIGFFSDYIISIGRFVNKISYNIYVLFYLV